MTGRIAHIKLGTDIKQRGDCLLSHSLPFVVYGYIAYLFDRIAYKIDTYYSSEKSVVDR